MIWKYGSYTQIERNICLMIEMHQCMIEHTRVFKFIFKSEVWPDLPVNGQSMSKMKRNQNIVKFQIKNHREIHVLFIAKIQMWDLKKLNNS